MTVGTEREKVAEKTCKRLVIVGGVAAGASAAAKARRMNESIEIVLLEAGPYISFANCGLPYYLGGEIQKRESLFVTSAELFASRFNVQVRTGTEATAIDRSNRKIRVRRADGAEELLSYDRLVLATGTLPLCPPIPGLDNKKLHTVRTVPDVDMISSLLIETERKVGGKRRLRALVVGGGYIGLEMAEQLAVRGLEVTLVEQAAQLLQTLDYEMVYPLNLALRRAGVELVLDDGLAEVSGSDETVARTISGKVIPFDLGILALGVRPNILLAQAAGLELGDSRAIRVDAMQRTSDPLIYAAGDNCESEHLVLGKKVCLPLAGPANKAGRVAGGNAALDLLEVPDEHPSRLRFKGVLGTAVVRVFGNLAARTGINEKEARREGIPYGVTYMAGPNHAGYYPGAQPMNMKVIHHKETGRILGAQCVGGEGVEKRIDVVATAIMGQLAVDDLEQLDLCYAPPVGSAKDILVQAGFSGSNARRQVMPEMTPEELLAELEGEDPPTVIDVRTPREYAAGHLKEAVNIPLEELRKRHEEIPQKGPVALYCRGGYRSYLAQRILMNKGWGNLRNVQGGYMLICQVQAASS